MFRRLLRSVCALSSFFQATPPTVLSTLSLHDALPISDFLFAAASGGRHQSVTDGANVVPVTGRQRTDRKSTRLNSSHVAISYAVFCLKKKIQSGRGRGSGVSQAIRTS